MRTIQTLALAGLLLTGFGCSQPAHQRNGAPAGYSQAQMELDYRDCEYKARLANHDHFYSQTSPFPYGPSPQSPVDHARALHGISSINSMRDTCLAAKGYRVE
jgi:hypothetical protein